MRFIRINQYFLDIQSHRLLHGDKSVALSSDTYALLRYFCNHPLRTVTIREIGQCLNQEDATIQTITPVIEQVRQLLDDDSDSYRMLVSSENGFRFVANIEWLEKLPKGRESNQSSEFVISQNWLWFGIISFVIIIPFLAYYFS